MAAPFEQVPGGYGHLARNPKALGVVEFLPGAFWGIAPQFTYSALLDTIYDAGYTIIALTIRLSLDHQAIADQLLADRADIDAELGNQATLPRFWVAHSLGCKFVALLEEGGHIQGEPSILVAPVIADTAASLPAIPVLGPLLADALDAAGLGVRPSVAETKARIEQHKSTLFERCGLIAFDGDDIAKDTVGWLLATLQGLAGTSLEVADLPGSHDEPVGFVVDGQVVHIDPSGGLLEHDPLPVAQQIVAWLDGWV